MFNFEENKRKEAKVLEVSGGRTRGQRRQGGAAAARQIPGARQGGHRSTSIVRKQAGRCADGTASRVGGQRLRRGTCVANRAGADAGRRPHTYARALCAGMVHPLPPPPPRCLQDMRKLVDKTMGTGEGGAFESGGTEGGGAED